MSFAPAVVIPIYNHGATIGATVAKLAPHGLAVFIVDDGSDDATQAVLGRLAAEQPLVRLSRLPQNGGKGAAVMAGMRAAAAAGHSHILQIDADGQHDIADLPRFLDAARTHPGAVIEGVPIYDASAPKSRLYGRLITRFWVRIETLSGEIGDAMLGFRVYPLPATLALIDRVAVPTRMDFDIEILVRLVWDGVRVVQVPTRVIYPADGISHFDMLRDNVRISWMHTRLCTRMLLTLPLILWRRRHPRVPAPCPAEAASVDHWTPDRADQRRSYHMLPPLQGEGRGGDGVPSKGEREVHWSRQSERGSSLGMAILLGAYRLLGDGVARAMLKPIVFWHWLFGRTARRASLDYLARLHRFSNGATPAPSAANAYRHLLAFAHSALDKVAGWSGRIAYAAVDFPNREQLHRLNDSGRGAILLGAHLGNLEMMRALALGNSPLTVNAVVYSEHAVRFTRSLAAANANFRLNLLHVPSFGPDTAILLREKIDRGEFLVIVGDRTPPAENGRVVTADFLGAPAPFPQGPYILAALLECPIYLFVCLREADGYRVHFEPFAEHVELPRRTRQEALAGYAQRYADRLAALCLKAPLQWFNFFDFWQAASPPAPSPAFSQPTLPRTTT